MQIKKLLSNKILNYNSKIQIYKTIIRPTGTYGSETWVLTVSDENQLNIFERKILKKFYWPTQNPDESLRIKTNEELRHKKGSSCNENGENTNYQKNSRMDSI
jgi:hypothetical protein